MIINMYKLHKKNEYNIFNTNKILYIIILYYYILLYIIINSIIVTITLLQI